MAASTSSLFSPHRGVGDGCLFDKYMYGMTSQASFHGGLGSCFVCHGNKIAYCSANSITLESPYHYLRGGSSEREAARCRDHHQLTVACIFEIKRGVLLGEAGWRRSN